MEFLSTPIEGLWELHPAVFADERGYFFESFNVSKVDHIISNVWVQDNESKSSKGVLRGLHYQVGSYAQAKLVRAVIGEIFDVAVDLRPDSATFGQSYSTLLTGENKKQLYIPRGFAHGFLVMSESAIFSYKCDNYYSREHEGGLLYNDPTLSIAWPQTSVDFLLSEKDKNLPKLGEHKPFY